MSFPLLDGIHIFHYSINSLLTAFLGIAIFIGILYGAYKAHMWETVTLWEIFHKTGVKTQLLSQNQTHEIGEEQSILLILAQIPFLGYIIASWHPQIPHMRDISMLNLCVSLIAVVFYIFGYSSLANIILLVYIIWTVLQSIRLIIQQELSTIDMSNVPSPQQKYILTQTLLIYLYKLLHHKKDFVDFQSLKKQQETNYELKKQANLQKIQDLQDSKFPNILLYIPGINLLWIFFIAHKEQFHIKNGLALTLCTLALVLIFGLQSPVGILLLFPISYGIGNLKNPVYQIPYLYDVIDILWKGCFKFVHLFRKTRELQKKNIQQTTVIAETKTQA